jgi:undecaprenyl-diphosphatase
VRKFDRTILVLFRDARDVSDPIGPSWLEEMARDITALGSCVILSILSCPVVIDLFMARQRAAAFWVLAAVGGGVLRTRPDLVPHAVRIFTTSFPSGHATLSAIIYQPSVPLLAGLHDSSRFKVYFLSLAILMTVAVGINRVYLSVQNPTDVLAGMYWRCVGCILLDHLSLAASERSRGASPK